METVENKRYVRFKTSRYSKYAEIGFVDILLEDDKLLSDAKVTSGRIINTAKFNGKDCGNYRIITIRVPKREVLSAINEIEKFGIELETMFGGEAKAWQYRLITVYPFKL